MYFLFISVVSNILILETSNDHKSITSWPVLGGSICEPCILRPVMRFSRILLYDVKAANGILKNLQEWLLSKEAEFGWRKRCYCYALVAAVMAVVAALLPFLRTVVLLSIMNFILLLFVFHLLIIIIDVADDVEGDVMTVVAFLAASSA